MEPWSQHHQAVLYGCGQGVTSEVGHEKNRILDAFLTGVGNAIIINFNYKEGWMDHIKLMIYGFIGMGALVAIIALLTQMLGIARG